MSKLVKKKKKKNPEQGTEASSSRFPLPSRHSCPSRSLEHSSQLEQNKQSAGAAEGRELSNKTLGDLKLGEISSL